MTEKWMPEVGDVFEGKRPHQDDIYWLRLTARYVGKKFIIGEDEDGHETSVTIGSNIFRPIPKDPKRDEQLARLKLLLQENDVDNPSIIAENLYEKDVRALADNQFVATDDADES